MRLPRQSPPSVQADDYFEVHHGRGGAFGCRPCLLFFTEGPMVKITTFNDRAILRAREQVAQCARDNQVLLHLPKIGPGGRGGPSLDEGQGNHSSISTAVFTISFQSGIRSFAMAFCGSSCLTDGSIAVNDLALTAKGRRALAWRSCPKRSSK